MNFPALYPILDASILPAEPVARREFLVQIVLLHAVGVGILQYRNKTGDRKAILADAAVLRGAAEGINLKLILNDWPELLATTDFHGVHVGQTDMPPMEARALIGEQAILGISTHNEAQLREAATQPVDYIAIGPIFPTASKENPDPVVGLEGIRLARSLTAKPIVAIGGIALTSAAEVYAAGADSIALISAIFKPGQNPAQAAAEFLSIRSNHR